MRLLPIDDEDQECDGAQDCAATKILAHAGPEGVEIGAFALCHCAAELDQAGEASGGGHYGQGDDDEAEIRPNVDLAAMLQVAPGAPPDSERVHALAFQAGIADAFDEVALKDE